MTKHLGQKGQIILCCLLVQVYSLEPHVQGGKNLHVEAEIHNMNLKFFLPGSV